MPCGKTSKKFAIKGNVIHLAVAVIIGGAFGRIVTSLVNDIIMPLIGLILGCISFSELAVTYNKKIAGKTKRPGSYGV